ncbi:hypothetical protein FA13DRAFT_1739615 [Coprinellus micaceus]|uniref:Uncharacterized protein n=1 Tax=Coprinellus micaceus TaxID=71717 RepID=A0A4Y7SQR3_COPMI|nr:hypothetical protein FA13DRAFT_1739615 [Coprinellus micaceus]
MTAKVNWGRRGRRTTPVNRRRRLGKLVAQNHYVRPVQRFPVGDMRLFTITGSRRAIDGPTTLPFTLQVRPSRQGARGFDDESKVELRDERAGALGLRQCLTVIG